MFVVKANNEELEIIEEADPESKELSVVELAKESKAIVELSINSVVALSNPGTMKVRKNSRRSNCTD